MKSKITWLNEKGTYEIQNEKGEVIEKFRNKDTAVMWLRKLQKQHYDKLTIVKIKTKSLYTLII